MRKKLKKRILVFSTAVAFASIILATIVFYVFGIILPYRDMKDINQGTLERIYCRENICDISDLVNDWSFLGSDYVLMKEGFFIFSEDYPGFWLNFSDPSFIGNFREPTSYESLVGERWRLYSVNELIDDKNIEVMVGWIERTPALLVDTPRISKR